MKGSAPARSSIVSISSPFCVEHEKNEKNENTLAVKFYPVRAGFRFGVWER
jgi:hypothetical protein